MDRFTAFLFLACGVVASCGGSTETAPVSSGSGGTAGNDAGPGGTGGSSLGGTGGTDPVPPDGPVDPPGSLLQNRTFNILIPSTDAGQWCQGDCTPATLFIEKGTDTSLEAVWGSTGSAARITLARGDGVWELTGTLLLGKVRTWSHAMCDNETVLGPAKFRFLDLDHDNRVDVAIEGHQSSKYCSDDYSMVSEGEVALEGRRDERVPIQIGPEQGFEPVHGFGMDMDKPMEKASTAILEPQGGGESINLVPREMNGFVVGFDTTRVLPLGITYLAKITGKDFGGIGTPMDRPFQTMGEFGSLAQDGFESGSMEGIHGANIVESYGVPALQGSRMLQVPAGAQALLHLERTATESGLTMSVRKYVACYGMQFDGAFSLEAGLVGANGTHAGAVTLGANPTQAEVEGKTIVIGELQKVSIDLPEPGKDVLVYMKGDDYQGAGCSMVGVLLDDVKLQ